MTEVINDQMDVAALQRRIAELEAKVSAAEAAPKPPSELPKYRCIEPFHAHDVLWPADTIMEFDGTPSPNMEPLNEPARLKMIPVLAANDRRPRDQQIQEAHEALNARNRAAAEPIAPLAMPVKLDGVPIMPNHVLPGEKRRPGRPRGTLKATPPDPHSRPITPVMGTVVLEKGGSIDTGGGLSI